MSDKVEVDIQKIKELLGNIDQDLETLYQYGKMVPYIERNVKQIRALLYLLQIECPDLD